MIPFLTGAVIVLAIAVAANLFITFAMIRRLRASEIAARDDADSFRPTVGNTIGEFEVTSTDGAKLTHRDLADGSFRIAFLLPECGGCGRVVSELAELADRSVIVAVAGTAGDPATVKMIQSIPDDLRVILSPVGGAIGQAFHLATFPTVVEIVDGRVTGVGETFAAPTVARVTA
ncbi:MAG TPA: hypothetical protein DGG94_05415 [Micromonosporaceae bacterium]|nr:hypothetical protein [Micromonosporaceae bacterium]HCU49238.1 hypothetical protein [Micromonosporaceae bacterium]